MRLRLPLQDVALVLLAVAGTVFLAAVVMRPPRSDLEQLALILSATGAGSVVLGRLALEVSGRRLGSLRLRIVLASVVGLAVIVANIVAAVVLMFLNAHDLTLLLLVLAFAAAVSTVFAYHVARTLSREIDVLSRTARRLAEGDLDARVHAIGNDEVARLGATFDSMATDLQAAFEREHRLEDGRRGMIAAVSHDLRTPLATTQAMIEALADGVVADSDEVRRYIEAIRGEVQHLARLIDDLFELSQIESGTLHLHIAPTRLAELVVRTVEAYRAQAQDRGVSLESVVEPKLATVPADAARMQRVLRNLIDNGLRYTPPGGVLRVEARPVDGAIRVAVSDSGPGIAPEELERVFDRFYREELARSRSGSKGSSVGAGLGLAIARALVQAHGGRIWAERRAGGGAVFQFTIPLGAE